LYALPPQMLSPCAAVVRDELKRVVRQRVQAGDWQGVTLVPASSEGESETHEEAALS
jgi:hypothetical protein